jgi:DNA-binding MarR family transcriptional regulator
MERFKPLDPLMHSPLRLAIISTLIEQGPTVFTSLKKICGASSGNLSVQLSKLEQAGYISREKIEEEEQSLSCFEINTGGIQAFERYLAAWKSYLPRK